MLMRVSLSTVLLLTGCAGPIGPPFGPGPETDSAFGIARDPRCSLASFTTHQRVGGSRRPLSLLPFTSCEKGMRVAK